MHRRELTERQNCRSVLYLFSAADDFIIFRTIAAKIETHSELVFLYLTPMLQTSRE